MIPPYGSGFLETTSEGGTWLLITWHVWDWRWSGVRYDILYGVLIVLIFRQKNMRAFMTADSRILR